MCLPFGIAVTLRRLHIHSEILFEIISKHYTYTFDCFWPTHHHLGASHSWEPISPPCSRKNAKNARQTFLTSIPVSLSFLLFLFLSSFPWFFVPFPVFLDILKPKLCPNGDASGSFWIANVIGVHPRAPIFFAKEGWGHDSHERMKNVLGEAILYSLWWEGDNENRLCSALRCSSGPAKHCLVFVLPPLFCWRISALPPSLGSYRLNTDQHTQIDSGVEKLTQSSLKGVFKRGPVCV